MKDFESFEIENDQKHKIRKISCSCLTFSIITTLIIGVIIGVIIGGVLGAFIAAYITSDQLKNSLTSGNGFSMGTFDGITEDTESVFWGNVGRGVSTYSNPWDEEVSVTYMRWYWDEIEPTQDNYDFSQIDLYLENAKSQNKLFAFRIMPFQDQIVGGSSGFPSWLAELMNYNGYYYNDIFIPNHNDGTYLNELEKLVVALGNRYGKNKWIEYVDVSGVGFWGEWHLGGVAWELWSTLLPSDENTARIVDMHLAAFQNYPVIMLSAWKEKMAIGLERGCGIRADCWGSSGDPNNYQEIIEIFGDSWKTVPLYLETCYTIPYWYDSGYDVVPIYDWALNVHTAGINPKDDHVDAGTQQTDYENFVKYLGYRYVFTSITYEIRSDPRSLYVSGNWENVGVSPIYINAKMSYILWKKDGDSNNPDYELLSTSDLKTWLPGSFVVEDLLTFGGSDTNVDDTEDSDSEDSEDSETEDEDGNYGVNLITNGDFTDGIEGWYQWSNPDGKITTQYDGGSFMSIVDTNVPNGGVPAFTGVNFALKKGTTYKFQIDILVTLADTTITIHGVTVGDFVNFGILKEVNLINGEKQTVEVTFDSTLTTEVGRIELVSDMTVPFNMWIDNAKLREVLPSNEEETPVEDECPTVTNALYVESLLDDDDSWQLGICIFYEPETGKRIPIEIAVDQWRKNNNGCYVVT